MRAFDATVWGETTMGRSVFAARALLIPLCGYAVLTGVPSLTGTASAATGPATTGPATTGPATTGPAARAPDSAILTLNNAAAPVKTANGQSWGMSVADTDLTDTLTAGLFRTVTAGGTGSEEHEWTFDVPTSALTFDTSTGVGTLKGGSATSPVATIDLNFKATSHKAATCTSGSETVYTGTLSGEAKLVTSLTGGGTVGGASVTFNFKESAPHMLVDSGCVAPLDECLAETSFSSSTTGTKPEAGGLEGTEDGTKVDFVLVARKKTLSSPKGAFRTDDAEIDTSPPSWNAKTGVLSVTTSSAGIVTGSATLSGGTVKTTTFPCTFGGKSYTMHVTQNTTANYSSPAGKAITAHTSLTGKLAAAAAKGTGLIDIVTASK
jgi:hypothetical protein